MKTEHLINVPTNGATDAEIRLTIMNLIPNLLIVLLQTGAKRE